MKNARLKLYIFSAAALVLLLIPCKCFAENVTTEKAKADRQKLVEYTKKCIGKPYVRGAVGPDAYDCSGLIFSCSRESIGHQLPRTVAAIYKVCKIVPDEQLEPGDLLFFKTTDGVTISHVGLYIGDKQFISAVSDGASPGVKISTLTGNYWKNHYACGGKFLKDTKTYETKPEKQIAKSSGSEKKTNTESSGRTDYKPGIQNLNCLTYATGDWSFFTSENFSFRFCGVTAAAGVEYEGKYFTPGAQVLFRWNKGTDTFQIPLIASVQLCEYVRAYAGPVFTLGKPHIPGSEEIISPSIFPGLAGITFQTPSLTKGKVKLRFIQDICYTFFNKLEGSALSPAKSLSSGLEFTTGLSVTFPFSNFLK